MRQHIKNIIKKIERMTGRYDTWTIFSDFIAMAAISIRNSVDIVGQKRREEQYRDIVNKYNEKELNKFPEIFGELVMGLEKEEADILGDLFMELNLGNKWGGQFFTPINIAECMADMMIGDNEKIKKDIGNKGYVTVHDPASGAGAMIIGMAKAMKKQGYNYQKQMVAIAQDIDIRSTYMAYIQLSLLGIPAKVIHGNSLTMEIFDIWYTPFFILDLWKYRLSKEQSGDEQIIKFTAGKDGQLSIPI